MSITLYPAIDVRGGGVVRLRQGDYAQETRYDTDPLALALHYAGQGADWLHLVDLDAARAGGYTLASLLGGIKAATALDVQTGGGVRSDVEVEAILAAGADRVVVGSLAILQPKRIHGWLQRFGAERITVALDVRRAADGTWRLSSHGWTQDSRVELEALLVEYVDNGLRHLLCTDIGRDGMLSGPNLDLYRHILRIAPDVQLQASGGIRDVADVIAAGEAGCAGAVLGKALLDGRFALAAALRESQVC